MEKLKIGIFGLGAIGSVMSFRVHSEQQLYYYNRSAKSEIKLQIEDTIQRKKIRLSQVETAMELDWLLICLKEYHYPQAEAALSTLITANTKIAVIRNGINLKEPILKFTAPTKILECMIDCPTQLTAQGQYHQLRKPIITVSRNQLAEEFINLFSQEGIAFRKVEDFQTANWEKLIESSALGGILALSGESCWIFKDKRLLALYESIVEEGIEVAKAEGANMNSSYKKKLFEKLHNYPPAKSSSMLIDRQKGNPIEINAKNGVISALGKQHGIKTELNDLICLLLQYTNTKEGLT